ADFTIGENRIGLRRVAVRALVEAEKRVDVAAIGVQRDLRRGAKSLQILRRHDLLANVRLICDDLTDGNAQVGGETPDEPPESRPAQEEGRVGNELDR